MENKQRVINLILKDGSTGRKKIVRKPQPWKCGWKLVRYRSVMYELIYGNRGELYIDLRKPKRVM